MSSLLASVRTTPAGAFGDRRDAARELGRALASISSIRQPMTSSNSATWSSVEARRAVEEQVGDAAQRLRALLRRAVLDDVFQFGKQGGGSTHYETCENALKSRDRRL